MITLLPFGGQSGKKGNLILDLEVEGQISNHLIIHFQMLYKAEDNVEGFLLECQSKLLAEESKSWLDRVS